jgi:hypothetical protein
MIPIIALIFYGNSTHHQAPVYFPVFAVKKFQERIRKMNFDTPIAKKQAENHLA